MQGEDVLNRNPGGEFANIFPDEGPDGTPGGAYRFIGTPESYVEFENDEERLEAKNSLSLLAWIKHTGNQGPIFNYDTDGWGVHFWMRGKNKLFARFNKRGNVEVSSISSNGVKAGVWQYVGATYNGQTGMAKLFISDRFVVEKYIGKGFQLATNHNVRMGARLGDKRYFNGSISCMQVYSKALSHNQIMSFKKRCFRTSSLCLWFDTSCYWRSNSSQSSWVKKMQSGDYLSDQLKMKWDTQDVDEDFELHLSPSSKEVVEIQKSSKETNSFTICFWKKGGGIYVRSYLWLNISQEIFVNLQSPKSFGFVHNSTAWNFYCFLMAGKDEKVAVSFYLNGERKSLLLIKPEEINNETLTVGYLNSSVNDKAVLSSFNIWSGELSPSEVKRLSYGCDSERGDVIHWKDFNYVDHDHEVVETRTCKNVRSKFLK
ncbi:uncharacterized protein LOC110241644 [Exaiptasia diaphana]|uniref:LamG-like jellyroll fold domain-containing protein n=1 Tax=Exaiptasia diaphana TaxID=2652724 RepID=A0A913YME6_EXADI|nr:uncharacterized protein LOC110241644 [Exaiptasia diaphana]